MERSGLRQPSNTDLSVQSNLNIKYRTRKNSELIYRNTITKSKEKLQMHHRGSLLSVIRTISAREKNKQKLNFNLIYCPDLQSNRILSKITIAY